MNVNNFIFTRTQPKKKLEVIEKLSNDELLAVSESTVKKIIKEVGCRRYKSRDKELRIDYDRRVGNNWNSTVESIDLVKGKLYVGFYVQYSFSAFDGSPHITATFTPEEHVVHSTDTLDSLKDYLEVVFWEDGVEAPVDVTEVMLNGELEAYTACKIIAFWEDYATTFWVEVDS
jgi:hypothetical protein